MRKLIAILIAAVFAGMSVNAIAASHAGGQMKADAPKDGMKKDGMKKEKKAKKAAKKDEMKKDAPKDAAKK